MVEPRTRQTVISAVDRTSTMRDGGFVLNSTKYLPGTVVPYGWDDTIISSNPGNTKIMRDYVTPNYWNLVKQGKIINNPLFIETIDETNPLLDIELIYDTYKHMLYSGVRTEGHYSRRTYSGQCDFNQALGNSGFLNATLSTDELSYIDDRAILKAWAKINDSDILMGAAIAESGKTAGDLLKLARKAIKILKFLRKPKPLKRFNRSSVKNAAREAEELYMQARYNLRPVYYDILGVMKLTTTKFYAPRYTFRSWQPFELSEKTSSVAPWPKHSGIKIRVEKESRFTYEARAGVLCNVQDETLWRRLGVSMIAETAYELVPGSFILDWFADFGTLISAWAPAPGVKPLASWLTVTQRWEERVETFVDSIYDVDSPNFVLGKTSRTLTSISGLNAVKTKTRSVITRRINPRRPYLPNFQVNLSPAKILDLAIIGKNLSRDCKHLRSLNGLS